VGVTILGTSKAPKAEPESEDEEKGAEKRAEFPEEYEAEGEEEEEEEIPLYWKARVQVDTIVFPAVIGDLLVQEVDTIYLTNIKVSLPQGMVVLNDTLDMQVDTMRKLIFVKFYTDFFLSGLFQPEERPFPDYALAAVEPTEPPPLFLHRQRG